MARDFVHRSDVARREALLFWHRNTAVWNDDDDLPAQVTYNSGEKRAAFVWLRSPSPGSTREREREEVATKLGRHIICDVVFSVVVLPSLLYTTSSDYMARTHFFSLFFLTVLLRRNWLVWRQAVPQKVLHQIEKGERERVRAGPEMRTLLLVLWFIWSKWYRIRMKRNRRCRIEWLYIVF